MRITKINALVIVAATFFCAQCSDVSSGDIEKWTDNMRDFAKFRCQKPQRRAIRAELLLGDKMRNFEIAFPHAAVLHRCGDDTGCCSNLESFCAAKKSVDVTLVFRIFDRVGGAHRFETHQAKSDTECACKKFENFIK